MAALTESRSASEWVSTGLGPVVRASTPLARAPTLPRLPESPSLERSPRPLPSVRELLRLPLALHGLGAPPRLPRDVDGFDFGALPKPRRLAEDSPVPATPQSLSADSSKPRRSAEAEDDAPVDAGRAKAKDRDDDKSKPAAIPDPPLQRQVVNMSNEPNGNMPQCVADSAQLADDRRWARPSGQSSPSARVHWRRLRATPSAGHDAVRAAAPRDACVAAPQTS